MNELYTLARERLFGDGPWLARGEAYCALHRKLDATGLWQRDGDSWRPTPLGAALKVTLLMVFLGVWDDGEVPMVLEEHGLMTQAEVDEVHGLFIASAWRHAPSTNSETLLKPYVRRAFLTHFGAPARRELN